MTDDPRHWSQDPYWTEALTAWRKQRDRGVRFLTLDLEAIETIAFAGDGPAYALMKAMVSVQRDEGMDGYRGAPRVMLAAIMRLAEVSGTIGDTDRVTPPEPEKRTL